MIDWGIGEEDLRQVKDGRVRKKRNGVRASSILYTAQPGQLKLEGSCIWLQRRPFSASLWSSVEMKQRLAVVEGLVN